MADQPDRQDEPEPLDPALLARAARYFSGRPEFLGYWLELYRQTKGLELPALARVLDCSLETLQHLALCLRPRPERLSQDTAELAARYRIDPHRLANLLHHAQASAAPRTVYRP